MTATQGGADQKGETVVLSGKELGDKARGTPLGTRQRHRRKAQIDPVKGENGRHNQGSLVEELTRRLWNRSQALSFDRFVRTGRELKPDEEEGRTRQGGPNSLLDGDRPEPLRRGWSIKAQEMMLAIPAGRTWKRRCVTS